MKHTSLLLFCVLFFLSAAQFAVSAPAYLYDANGNPISSTAGALNVNATVAATVNTNGSLSDNAAIGSGSAVTFTAPANAVGFIIQASSSNSVNLRWAIGAVATTSSGMRLEPGRDSGYVPVDKNISVIAESGSNQEGIVIWVLSL